MEKDRENLREKYENDENLMLEIYDPIIQDNTEKNILELIVKDIPHEDMLNQLLTRRR